MPRLIPSSTPKIEEGSLETIEGCLLETHLFFAAKQPTDTNDKMMMMIDDATVNDDRSQLNSLTIQVLSQAIQRIDDENELDLLITEIVHSYPMDLRFP